MQSFQRKLIFGIVFSLFALSFNGCGGENRKSFDPTGKHKMEEIGQMLSTVKTNGETPPARLDDLARVEPMIPLSASDLRSGDIVYVWGAGLSTDNTTANSLLAYEKKTPSEGGWALMQIGSVKQLTAQEFNTSSKAKSN